MTVTERARQVARPLVRHKRVARTWWRARRLTERAKYWDAKILSEVEGNDVLLNTLHSGRPSAVAKIGATELVAIRHYLANKDEAGFATNWGTHGQNLYGSSGVFPADPAIFSRFASEYLRAIHQIDILCVWFHAGERSVVRHYAADATYIPFYALEPYYHATPWSSALAGKKVLVITPFADSIKAQYTRRREIWVDKPEVLPDFDLDVLQTPFSAALAPPVDANWFVALDRLRDEMASREWDAAIIGAGAWSLPLTVHALDLGRWGIHLGGATQLLFGIKGGRWETGNRKDPNQRIAGYYNAAWARPSDHERPRGFKSNEGGAYW